MVHVNWERVGSLELQLGDEVRASANALSVTEGNLGKEVARVDRRVVNVAVGGLALQAWGIILVTVGTVFAVIPAMVQI
jgi:hypothetical protein